MADIIAKLGFLAGSTRFRRISEKLYVDGDKIYKDQGIDFKASWFSVYYLLANSAGHKTVVELAEEIGVSHITVKNVVRELEDNGLVKIGDHPTDGRSKHISLSASGKKLLGPLQKVWIPFSAALQELLDAGHPDFLNIISRVEREIVKKPINERAILLRSGSQKGGLLPAAGLHSVRVVDYKPSLKKYFYELAGNWLLGLLNGTLEKEDEYTLHNPDKAYLEKGGFLFFALYEKKVVGCVALKRLDEDSFEFAKLFIDPDARQLGIATKLIERCITRCKENDAKQLWLQTSMSMTQAHALYDKMGFIDRKAPPQMELLKRSQKYMVMDL